MRSSALTQWLNGLRSRSVPKPRRTVLDVREFETRLVPATLGGNVFNDLNGNGIRDRGEPGIAGVKVQLVGKTDCGQIVCKEAVTNCNGDYQFDGLRGGTYTVTECQPDGYKDGKDTPGSAGGFTVGRDTIACIRLSDCTTATGYNFAELSKCAPAQNGSGGKGSQGRGSGGQGSRDKGSTGSQSKGSGGKGSYNRCDSTPSRGKGSGGKGSGGKGSAGRGSRDKGSTGSQSNGSDGKGSSGSKGSSGKGSQAKVCMADRT